MKIPFMDLGLQFRSLEADLRSALEGVLSTHGFINGPVVQKFNEHFLKVHGARYGVGCSNGTSAITVALRALKIGVGDEVLVPNHTFFGTVEPIVEVGATPVLVDVDPEYHQLDLAQAAGKITARTKAIIPVHLYGLPEPMDQVMAFARKHGLKVIEDCAQAHCAKWQGQAVGTFGELATFSFFPGKNLGAFGDAGFISTQQEDLYDFVRRYIDHGRTDKYVHQFFGGNFRLDALQAAVLNVKVAHLESWSQRRRELAKTFDECLVPKGVQVLKPREGATPVYHLYVVQVSNRQEVQTRLQQAGIATGVHYPMTLNAQPAFADRGYKPGQFPVSERWSERALSLPFFPEMTMEQVELVVEEFLRVAEF